jgi:16S rRNA (cytidine1402-2'-O)-methyltransferase
VSGTLYLVGTPIGNLEDVTDRARRVLASVDLVAAEDTRRTGRFLSALGVHAPRLLSFFEGNEVERVPTIVEHLRSGEDVALVSDAGMPSISDPGYRLVAACIEAGIAVDVVPGPSAALAALVLSGLPTDRWAFEGFLPRSGRARRDRLGELAMERRTTVLFESPRRLVQTLRDLLASLGDRRAVVARELTKLHQEVLRGQMSELIEGLERRELKGEVVVVVEGAEPERGGADDAIELAAGFVASGARKREAARRAAEATGVPSAAIYLGLVDRAAGRMR